VPSGSGTRARKVDEVVLSAFQDELYKIAGIRDMWQQFLDVFRPEEDRKARARVDYHFSPKSGPEKWDKLVRNARDNTFLKYLEKHPDSDDKLVLHAKSMGELSRGQTVGKVWSSRLPGRSYEIKKIPAGLGCTCPDWRFKGSVNPGYQCKHIRAHKKGKVKADDVVS